MPLPCGQPRPLLRTIPIVFLTGADPVALGFVASLNQPGGNLTGLASLVNEIGPMELVHELLPTTSVFAVLVNPASPAAETVSRDAQSAARALGQTVHVLNASTEGEVDAAFARLRSEEHTSELQSLRHLVCRLLLEK